MFHSRMDKSDIRGEYPKSDIRGYEFRFFFLSIVYGYRYGYIILI